jgi:hypothetical protein
MKPDVRSSLYWEDLHNYKSTTSLDEMTIEVSLESTRDGNKPVAFRWWVSCEKLHTYKLLKAKSMKTAKKEALAVCTGVAARIFLKFRDALEMQ